MKRDECEIISALWVELNPHVQIHGCEVDPAGSVYIYVLYRREGKNYPLELCLGNPASTVIRGLRQAVNAQARTARLTKAYPSKLVDDGGKVKKNGKNEI